MNALAEYAVEARDVRRTFQDGARKLEVLRGASIKARPGETISITGASGSGKSTFLHLLGGLDRPTSGEIEFEGRSIVGLSENELSRIRARKVGVVFQFYHLLPEFSAVENVMIPRLLLGKSRQAARQAAEAQLTRVGLAERLTHRPAKMSGGEQQRVAIARALVNGPALILADEPTGNLDEKTSESILDLLWQSCAEANCALIMVTHEAHVAAKAQRHLRLVEGALQPE